MAVRTSQNNPIATASQIARGLAASAISWANRQVRAPKIYNVIEMKTT
jgi:uncharacterized protein YycO